MQVPTGESGTDVMLRSVLMRLPAGGVPAIAAEPSVRVTHLLSPSLAVALIPAGMDAPPVAPKDETEAMAIAAWSEVKDQSLLSQSPTPEEGLPWDAPEYSAPVSEDVVLLEDPSLERNFDTGALDDGAHATGPVAHSTGTPTSLYMIGSVAVGVVLVSANQGAEVLTQAEQQKVLQEVFQGLNWLANVEPRAKLTFAYDIQPVVVNAAPGVQPGLPQYERYERGWRDAALAALGYPAGRPGYSQYVRDICQRLNTQHGMVAFFTRYPLEHFAYAIYEKVVMHYENDGWGVNNIHRVFAHEFCHIFGAADEYGNCACNAVSGYLAEPNANCINCFPPGAQQQCLMAQNTLRLCSHSRRQIGWDASLFPQP